MTHIQWLDADLARLGHGAGALRLRLGEALEVLVRIGGHCELGFASVEAYALERCERGSRWAAESRAVARRLTRLPRLRAALVSGELSWSMTELVARQGSPENEEALLAEARGSTVRAMRSRLREKEDEGPVERRRSLEVTVSREDGWALEATRMLLGGCGASSTEAFVEAILAEGLTTLQSLAPESANAELEAAPRDTEWRAQLAAWRSEAEARCEAEVDRSVAPSAFDERPLPETINTLDGEIRRLSSELAARDLAMGELFARLRQVDGWRRLGWATEEQYARERMGVSYTSLKGRLTLARRSARLEPIGRALRDGRIGYEAAQLVARVATANSVAAWLDRAEERTVKHLRDEVEAVEMLARVCANASLLVPPDEETMQAYAALERYALSGALEEAPLVGPGASGDSQMSVGRVREGAGSVSFRFHLREELVAFWRDLEARFRRSSLPGSFVEFLCAASWRSWAHPFDGEGPYTHIYRRDRYRCMSPVCSRRDATPHHFVFRSRGGTDDDDNVGTVCTWCHLEGIHGGRIKAEPPASSPRWILGRIPILEVNGRRRIRFATQEWAARSHPPH